MRNGNNGWRVHWPADPNLGNPANEIRGYQQDHINANGWDDIAYNYIIDQTGAVWEGRGLGVRGAHTAGLNSTSHGVLFLANRAQPPTRNQHQAFNDLRAWANQQGWPLRPVAPHNATSATECPGPHLTEWVRTLNDPTTPIVDSIIASWQQTLNRAGANPQLVEDGVFGRATLTASTRAIRRLDPETAVNRRAALDAAVRSAVNRRLDGPQLEALADELHDWLQK